MANGDVILLWVMLGVGWGLLAFDLYQIVSVPALSGEARYSRGWEMLWAFGLTVGIWVAMGVLLYRLQVPGAVTVGLVSAAGALGVLCLMDEGRRRWPAAIPLGLSVAMVGGAFTRHWDGVRLAVLVVSLLPCGLWAGVTLRTFMGRRWARRARDAATRTRNLALVQTIGEHQPLWTWLPLTEQESGVRAEAVAALRRLRRRQADMEQMLGEGVMALDLVPELDLQPTPRLEQLINGQAANDARYARTMQIGRAHV